MPNSPHVDADSTTGFVRRTVRQAWRDLLSVYYANTLTWRFLKAGTLLWFGLMIWAFSNLILSYQPDWTVMYYVMAYGFVLVLWGPLTHFVVVPLVIRLRRDSDGRVSRTLSHHGSKLNLSVFFAIVIVLGALPFGPMVLDFQPPTTGGDGNSATITADLECEVVDDLVQCQLTDDAGYDHVVVLHDGEEIDRIDDPPYAFTLDPNEYDRFIVELRDADGAMLERYLERVDSLE